LFSDPLSVAGCPLLFFLSLTGLGVMPEIQKPFQVIRSDCFVVSLLAMTAKTAIKKTP
jgi:hypothetical protein